MIRSDHNDWELIVIKDLIVGNFSSFPNYALSFYVS